MEAASEYLTPISLKLGGKSPLDNITWEDAVMQEEIFGPIFPVLEYLELTEVIHLIKISLIN